MIKLFKQTIAAIFVATNLLGCLATAKKQALPERQKIAMAMFNDRCKKAGEFIHRSVDGVEGIYLLKLRPSKVNYESQFELDDPYGHDAGGDLYILNFLRGFQHQLASEPAPASPRSGYMYVEAQDVKDGKRYRYTGSFREVIHTSSVLAGGDGKTTFRTNEFVLSRAPADGRPPHYGVTYDDISTLEERKYWIAGSSLKVIDLQTNEVIAERVGYMVDWAQGSTAGGRSPWLFAADNACPDFNSSRGRRVPGPAFSAQVGQTLQFVEKVLRPSR